MMANAVKAAEQVQASGQTFQSTFSAAVAKGFDHAQANANATFDFAQKLVRTKDLREAFDGIENVALSEISNKDAIYNSIKDFLGKGS
jgi:hypothetical protein